MLCANREFAQSIDCPAQSNDRCFAQISKDCAILTQTRNAIAMAFGYLIRPMHALQMNGNSYIATYVHAPLRLFVEEYQ